MKSKKNKNGSALVFAMVILSISVIVALSIAASAVIARKGASSTERASRSFQEIDSTSDKFDKVFETTNSFLCRVQDYFDDDDNNSQETKQDCPGKSVEDGDHVTDFGTCNTATGKITSKDNDGKEISVTTIYDNNGNEVPCNSGLTLAEVAKTRTVSKDDQNKRAIENVPPCAGFNPDFDDNLIGRWDMDSDDDLIDCAIGSQAGKCIEDLSDNDNHMQLLETHHLSEAEVSKIPEIGVLDGDSTGRKALLINKDNKIKYKDSGKAYWDLAEHENTKFNFGQIPPIPEYAAPEGTVAFWFYAENKKPKEFGFSIYSRDMNSCLNDFVANGKDRDRDGEYDQGEDDNRNGILDPGEDDNVNGVFDADLLPVGGADAKYTEPCDKAGVMFHYGDVNVNGTDYSKYLCDCGHMSFMWNTHYWSTYKDQFGTRFQNDSNNNDFAGGGSQYRLSSGEGFDKITKNWHIAAITYNEEGAWLYYDNEKKAQTHIPVNPPDPMAYDQDGFEGLRGNFSWTYIGRFAGDMNRANYNVLKKYNADGTLNQAFFTNGTRYLEKQFAQGGFGYDNYVTNQMLFYPFKGGIRRLRIYNREFSECEIRKLKYYTEI